MCNCYLIVVGYKALVAIVRKPAPEAMLPVPLLSTVMISTAQAIAKRRSPSIG
ncbi:hypothetical protein M3J09_008435 [Ascochyta lentis]